MDTTVALQDTQPSDLTPAETLRGCCATKLLPEQAKLILRIISPIHHVFPRIAHPGSAQIGTVLNS